MIKKILISLGLVLNLIIGIYFTYPNEEKLTYDKIYTIYTKDITNENSAHLIGVVEKENIDKVILKIKNNDIKYLLITSPGGSVDDGMELIKIIEERKDIVCIADEAMSIAFILFQACSTRIATDRSVLMTHKAYIDPLAKAIIRNTNQLFQMQKEVDLFNEKMAFFLAERFGMTVYKYNELVKEDWFISNEDIKNFNIIDGLYNQSISNKY
jgi:ATP-dependent protease ClpP protease subunit